MSAAFPSQSSVKKQAVSSDAGEAERMRDIQLPSEREKENTSLYEMIQEAREKAEEQRKRFQLPKSSIRYGDAPIQAYARLAKARNRAEVDAASGYARRCIVQFQAAARRDSDNAERIRAAIRQLQKAVNRAGKKKRELDRERLVDIRRSNSEKEDQRREAQRLRQELRRLKTMRVIRESGYIREAEVDNRLQSQLSATRMELREQAQRLADSVSVDTAIRQYTAQVEVGVEASAPEINIEG